MVTKIKSFSPTSDWYFVFDKFEGGQQPYLLGGFAVIEEEGKPDSVIGMVPVRGGGQHQIMPGHCSLVFVPPTEGTYKHRSEITDLLAAEG